MFSSGLKVGQIEHDIRIITFGFLSKNRRVHSHTCNMKDAYFMFYNRTNVMCIQNFSFIETSL